MEKGLPADAHDAGSVAVERNKVCQLMLMMLDPVAVKWKKVFQLMLMMLGSWRWSGERFSS